MDITLLKKLICLHCHKPSLHENKNELLCSSCGQAIPLDNGIPDFLSGFQIGKIHLPQVSPDAYEQSISQKAAYYLARIDKPLLHYVHGDVLEIGCGTCRLAVAVEKRGAKYFGLDPLFPFLFHAQNHRGSQRLVRGQGEILPFQNESFDCIISGYCAYRDVRPELGLSEARRILKVDGRFTFDLLNHWVLKLMGLKLAIKRGWKFSPFFHVRPYADTFDFVNLSQLTQKAKEAGFLVENVISTPVMPLFPALNKYLRNFYYRGKWAIYLGYNVIIVLKAA